MKQFHALIVSSFVAMWIVQAPLSSTFADPTQATIITRHSGMNHAEVPTITLATIITVDPDRQSQRIVLNQDASASGRFELLTAGAAIELDADRDYIAHQAGRVDENFSILRAQRIVRSVLNSQREGRVTIVTREQRTVMPQQVTEPRMILFKPALPRPQHKPGQIVPKPVQDGDMPTVPAPADHDELIAVR